MKLMILLLILPLCIFQSYGADIAYKVEVNQTSGNSCIVKISEVQESHSARWDELVEEEIKRDKQYRLEKEKRDKEHIARMEIIQKKLDEAKKWDNEIRTKREEIQEKERKEDIRRWEKEADEGRAIEEKKKELTEQKTINSKSAYKFDPLLKKYVLIK